MGGQVAPPGSHLMYSPCDELAQSHVGSRGQGGEVVVVPRGREEAGPIYQEGLSYSCLKGGIGIVHNRRRWEDGGQTDKLGVDHGHLRKPVGEG